MKVSKLFCAVLLAGSLAVIGCGSDDGGSSGNGNGSADQVCADCANDVLRAACVVEYDQCIELNPDDPECETGARLLCGL